MIGWICGWPSSIRPGCGCRPKSMTTAMSTSIRPAWGWPVFRPIFMPPTARRWTSGWMRWRPRCARTIRAPRSSVAPMPLGRWRAVKPAGLPVRDRGLPGVAERAAASAAVIHVLAEQATIDGTSDHPGYLPGFGILPAESVRELAAIGHAQTRDRADGDTRCGLSALDEDRGVRAVAGSDVPLAGLRRTGRAMRYRPHGALAVRADASVEQQAVLPHPSSDQDVLYRPGRLDRPAVARRHGDSHRPDRAHLHHRTPRRQHVSALAQSTGELPIPTLADHPPPIARR